METEENKQKLRGQVHNVGYSAALVALAADDRDEAILLLRMSSGNANEILALAHLYQLEERDGVDTQAWVGPANLPGPSWETIIELVRGNLKRASELAKNSDLAILSAAISMFSGDPQPYLELSSVNMNFNSGEPRAASLYAELALKKWNGEKLDQLDIDRLLDRINDKGEARNQRDSRQAAAALAIFGRLDLAERTEVKTKRKATFVGMLSHYKDDEALALIGFEAGDRNFKKYVSDLLQESGEKGLSDSELEELRLLTHYLEVRNETAVIDSAVFQPLIELSKVNEVEFLRLVEALARESVPDQEWQERYEMPVVALNLAKKWADMEPARWPKVSSMFAGITQESLIGRLIEEPVNQLIQKISPNLDDAGRLGMTLYLLGYGTGNGVKEEQWMANAFEKISGMEDEQEKKGVLQMILKIGIFTGKANYSIQAWDALDDPLASEQGWVNMLDHLTAVGRWSEAADLLERFGDDMPMMAMYKHAYRGIALEREGKIKESVTELTLAGDMTLANSLQCNRLAGIYQQAGRLDDAVKWLEKATLYAIMGGNRNLDSLKELVNLKKVQRKWATAAACEVVFVSQKLLMEPDLSLSIFNSYGFEADLSTALARLDRGDESGISEIVALHEDWSGHGILGDVMFPELGLRGLDKELDVLFTKSWSKLLKLGEKFPDDHNLKNSNGWLASRANRKLEEAEKLTKLALEKGGQNAAYLDTMAEVKFAQGDRKKAMEWSEKALSRSPNEIILRLQNYRFRKEKLRN